MPFSVSSAQREKAREIAADAARQALTGGSCVAVPVRSDTGEIIAGLSFSVLLIGSFDKPLVSYVPVLQEASKEITNTLYR